MSPDDLEKILDACKPVPAIMLHIGGGMSQQERANAAWAELGKRMGFDHMTVQPVSGKDMQFFTAVSSETPAQKAERVAKEKKQRRQYLMQELHEKIAGMQHELAVLEEEDKDT